MNARIIILIAGPFTLAWAFVSTFWREVKLAPWYAWNEVRVEFDVIKRAWRSKSINEKDWS